VNLGNASIFGNAVSGLYGTWDVGPAGLISGMIGTDMNVEFPEVTVPFAHGGYFTSDNGAAIVGGVAYSLTFVGGYYKLTSISLSGSKEC